MFIKTPDYQFLWTGRWYWMVQSLLRFCSPKILILIPVHEPFSKCCILLVRLRECGKKTMIITNSEYEYTNVSLFLYPPQTKLRGYIVILMSVRSFVRPSVRPSQSLIRYSSKTAEQNFMKLSGIVHYMMPYCTSYFKCLSP